MTPNQSPDTRNHTLWDISDVSNGDHKIEMTRKLIGDRTPSNTQVMRRSGLSHGVAGQGLPEQFADIISKPMRFGNRVQAAFSYRTTEGRFVL